MKTTNPYSRLTWGGAGAGFVARWSKIACCAPSLLILAMLFAPPSVAEEAAADQSMTQARVSFAGGADMIKGSGDTDWSYATLNTVVAPGDSLWVDKEGTMEIEVAGGSFLRMADGSKVSVVSLSPSVLLKAETGSFYVQRLGRSTGDVSLETPVARILVDPNSTVRVDIRSDGGTTLTVRWGRAVVQCEGGSDVAAHQGQRSYIDPGYLPSTPGVFDRAAEDPFDTWNREQSRMLAVGADQAAAGTGIAPDILGATDLALYGDWVDIDGTSYWRPAIHGFIPYRDGYWSYVPGCGYVWVGDYPFSYITGHYGRWRYDGNYGWCWMYQPGWSPAWVATLQCGPDFMWCPLDPFGLPVAYWDDYCLVGGVRFGFYACSYCDIDGLLVGRCRVRPYTRGLFARAHEINIWNIDAYGRNHVRFRDAALHARDYWPHQVFRGRDTLASATGPARTRVTMLESTTRGIPHAAREAGVRTLMERHPGTGTVRSAQVSPAVVSQTRSALEREMRTASKVQPAALGTSRAGVPPVGRVERTTTTVRRTTSPGLNDRGSTATPRYTMPPSGTGHITMSAPAPRRDVVTSPRAAPQVRSSYSFPVPSHAAPPDRAYSPATIPSAPRVYSAPSQWNAMPRVYSHPSLPPAPSRFYSQPSLPPVAHSFSHMAAPGGRTRSRM